MYQLSQRSKQRISTTDERVQIIVEEAIRISPIDFGIPAYGGKRTDEEQHELFEQGKSKCDGYSKRSRHQSGLAFDIFPYVGGKADYDPRYCFMLAGVFLSVANDFGYKLKFGGDWDMDMDLDDQTFFDLVHFELVE